MSKQDFQKFRLLARVVKKNNMQQLFRDPNIIGMGYGRKIVHGNITNEPAVTIYVAKKMPKGILPTSKLLPRKVYIGGDCINVDVVETGPVYPLAFTARERPAPSGISVGHPLISAGTLGCLVTDLTDGSLCILSNNHVIANENAAALGDAIIQPGAADGGVVATDTIAALKRFQVINATGNTIDAAIAQVNTAGNVVNQMKNNLMAVPSPNHPAVGLLFAGSSDRTFLNPARDVLSNLNIDFVNGGPGAIVDPDIGMNVEKVGRTTEYTTSSILEIDVTISIAYSFGMATFDNQIATSCMGLGGDSGSVVCMGGEGQQANQLDCGCGSSQAAQSVLQRDIREDVAIEKVFREKYIANTLTGRYLLDVYFKNEDYILSRTTKVQSNKEDTGYFQHLYDKYANEFKSMAIDPDGKGKITANHLKEGKQALGRIMQYLNKEEQRAAKNVIEMAQSFEEKTVKESLQILNDKKFYNDVVKTVSRIDNLNTKDCCH
jgi:hypothetical protein